MPQILQPRGSGHTARMGIAFERAYTTYGDPAAPPIVLLHGIRLGRQIWEPEAPVLARDFHVIAADLPGHGRLIDEPFTDETVAALLEHLFLRVARRPPVVVGYSLGGYAAMNYAAVFPDHVRALLLSGCTLDFTGWKRWPLDATTTFLQALPRGLRKRALDVNLRVVLPDDWCRIVRAIPFNDSVLGQVRQLAHLHPCFSDTVARYPGRVRFVNGKRDFVFRIDERQFVRACAQGDRRLIPKIDHTAPFRKGRAFTREIYEFAREVFA